MDGKQLGEGHQMHIALSPLAEVLLFASNLWPLGCDFILKEWGSELTLKKEQIMKLRAWCDTLFLLHS